MGREFFVPAGTLIAVKLLLGLDSIDADPIRSDDITNSFNFDVWWFTPVEPFSTKNTNSLEHALYKVSTDIGLHNSKELSSLKKSTLTVQWLY